MPERNKWARRVILGSGATFASAGLLGYFALRKFPMFFQQYALEMKLPILPTPLIPDPRQWPDRGVHAAWLGHSTVLLKIEGYTILTDPMFSDRAGIDLLLFTVGLKRMVAPALPMRDLPPIDLVLVSHAHMDHLDIPSLRKLENKRTQVVMASRLSDLVRVSRYGKVTELGWGERTHAGPAQVEAFQVNHWGARVRTDTWRGYNGYLLQVNSRRVLFAGDTALTDTFRRMKHREGIDLAIMPVGAYNPWIRAHCTPEQAWRMGNDAGAEYLMPVHHSTFRLSQEPPHEPLERFLNAAASRPERVALQRIGQEFHLP
ncbi:MAG TPA: MBL fold metallo-hydrolase [Bryobacteraceae bacterium]|nr:MBL fold metallo-hydrolase [Bryobacteraceae bacterium]